MNDSMMNEKNEITVAEVATPVAKRGRGRPPKVEKAIFMEMWNKADSLGEVAGLLGMSKASCSVRASNLRKQGYDILPFARGRKPRKANDVEAGGPAEVPSAMTL